MTNIIKTWHLLPTFDVAPPPSSPLQLGSIIAAKTPPSFHSPLNHLSPPYIPDSLIKSFSPGATTHVVKQASTGNIGFAAKLAQLLGLGPEISFRWANKKEVQYSFDKEHDRYFEPDLQIVRDAVSASLEVQDYLNGTSHRKPVYMVTGIKWVEGIKIKVLKSTDKGGDVKLAVDGTPAGVPIEGDVHGGGSRMDEEEHTAQGSDSFVFAVRLFKISFSSMGDAQAKSHTDGAFLGNVTKDKEGKGEMVMNIGQAGANDFEDSQTVDALGTELGAETEIVYEDD